MEHPEWDDWNDDPTDDIPLTPDDDFSLPDFGDTDYLLDHDHDIFDDPDDTSTTTTGGDPLEEPLALDALDDDPDPDSWDIDPDTSHLLGADPDLIPEADDPTWAIPTFPEALDLSTPPEPIDGFPWIDPTILGEPSTLNHTAWFDQPQHPTPEDLAAYATTNLPPGQDPWSSLLGSDDPATSSLARWWSPGN